jgi:hypothetical protein
MKKIIIPLSVLAFTGCLLFSCDELLNPSSINGELLSHSDCKSSKSASLSGETPDTLSCVHYTFNASENTLSVSHINAAFNCCPGEIKCDFSIDNDTIIIEESERTAQCSCDCLFDLEMEITGVESGDYIIKVVELYAGEEDKLIFEINLDDEDEGSFCVTRKQYPWGLSSMI